MKAVIYQSPGVAHVVDRPKPPLRDDYILIKVTTIALNPTDWKHVAGGLGVPGCICGVDYAGVVEEVGSGVTRPFKKGDRIAGWTSGCNISEKDDGAFAEWIVAKGDLQIKVPDNVSDEEAATWGCGVATCGQGLFESGYGLGLNPPSRPVEGKPQVLVYGGSTATGTLGIQFLKVAGYEVLTTCSPKHFPLVKSLGVTEAFDYNAPNVGKTINEYTKNGLKYAWDCISVESSAKICAEALSTEEGSHYGCLLTVNFPRKDVKYSFTLLYNGTGEDFKKYGNEFKGEKAHFEAARRWIGEVEGLIKQGKLKAHPVSVREGGLEGAIQGLKDMEKGKYSGEKLVYRIA